MEIVQFYPNLLQIIIYDISLKKILYIFVKLKYMENENIDLLTDTLNTKIQQINQLKQLLTKQLQQVQSGLHIRNKLTISIQNQYKIVSLLKAQYGSVKQIPQILQNMHFFNLFIIQQIQAKYHEQFLKMKLKYESQIKDLNMQIQTQHKIRKSMIEQVQQLKKCVQKFISEKQNVKQKQIIKIIPLDVINQQDQIQQSKKTQQSKISQTNIQQEFFQKIILVDKDQIQDNKTIQAKKQSKLFLETFKKIMKQKYSLPSMKQQTKIQQSYNYSKDYLNQTDQLKINKYNSIPTTPIKQKTIFGNTRQIFNNKNNTQRKNKSTDKLRNQKLIVKGRSNSKQKLTIRKDQKTQLFKTNQKRNIDLIKNYLSIKQNQQNLIQKYSNSFLVGDKKIEIKYQGTKRDGKRNGSGTIYYSNGLIFQGSFRDNKRCGYGVLKFNQIEIYSGQWQNDMVHGKGKIKNCSIIVQKNQNNNQMMLSKWISYSGEFKQNRFHGNGTLNLQNGQRFSGKFNNGFPYGEGTIYKRNGDTQTIKLKN